MGITLPRERVTSGATQAPGKRCWRALSLAGRWAGAAAKKGEKCRCGTQSLGKCCGKRTANWLNTKILA